MAVAGLPPVRQQAALRAAVRRAVVPQEHPPHLLLRPVEPQAAALVVLHLAAVHPVGVLPAPQVGALPVVDRAPMRCLPASTHS